MTLQNIIQTLSPYFVTLLLVGCFGAEQSGTSVEQHQTLPTVHNFERNIRPGETIAVHLDDIVDDKYDENCKISIEEQPTGGILTVSDQEFEYRNTSGLGSDAIRVRMLCGAAQSAVAVITFQVQNGAPVVQPIWSMIIFATKVGQGVDINLDNFIMSDPDGDNLTVRITRHPATGTLTTDGDSFHYVGDSVGMESFFFVVSDGWAKSQEFQIHLRVE